MRVYSTRWLVLLRRAGSHSSGSPSNHIAWTSRNFYFAPLLRTLGIPALVNVAFKEYTRYIPGIFKVYTKGWAVDKRLDPVAALAPGYL